MKVLCRIMITAVLVSQTAISATELYLSRAIYSPVPFSDQFSDQGALIKNVHFRAVNALIPQIKEKLGHLLDGQDLVHRGESHITIITPPEAQGWNYPSRTGISSFLPTDVMISMFRQQVNMADFEVDCLGMQKSLGKTVFYLVLKNTEDIISIRQNIDMVVDSMPGGASVPFKPAGPGYDPHITIGFIGDDIYNVDKSAASCLEDVKVVID